MKIKNIYTVRITDTSGLKEYLKEKAGKPVWLSVLQKDASWSAYAVMPDPDQTDRFDLDVIFDDEFRKTVDVKTGDIFELDFGKTAGTHKVEVTGIRKDEPLNHIENKEIWDLYDHDGKLTGETFERRFGNFRNIPDGRYHLVVDLLVSHSDGTYLLTRRSEEKDWYPGYWEASAGGAALKGEEPLDAANRELTEETGLIPDSLELVDVSFKDSTHAMYYSYIARVSGDKDGITLQEGETTDYKWVDAAGFISYVDSDGAMKSHNQRYEKYISTLR